MEAPSMLAFACNQTFFGFNPEDQVQLHDHIFELIWAGDGRWDWDTVYNLPIQIRNYWVKKINAINDASSKSKK